MKAPDIDGIQNYWWKKLEPAQKALTRAFKKNIGKWKNCAIIKIQKPGG